MSDRPLLVISCSLNPTSRSRRLAQVAAAAAEAMGRRAEAIDLRDVDLPICDGGDDVSVSAHELREKISRAHAVLLAAPVYNYDVNAAAKNLIEVTGSAWNGKVVGLMAAAGGRSSYMSLMGLANSLMLDFRCWVVPRFVYVTKDDAPEDAPIPKPLAARIEQLARTAWDAASVLRQVKLTG